ncbi:MAG: amidohydrolase family protein [Bryobacterales bacterium]|nr:amidohydrolase family protein [Bryobacteraceae bacterium]MDW8353686.1 amidohydrolase family protein [Bryobacterales bacterium]
MNRVALVTVLAWVASAQVVVFENVNVIPMDRERILAARTVLVRDGRIAEIGPANRVRAPEGAVRVDGRGKYLMPGFAEMHGHLPGPDVPREVVEDVMFLYVANGVTTVRGMLGNPIHLQLRREVAEGKLLGPRLYVAGPAFAGAKLTPEEARQRVREQKEAGYDLLKVLEGLRPETYEAMAAEAKAVGIPFAGHVPDEVGLLRCLEVGQKSIDHLDGYLEALEADDSPLRNADPKIRRRDLGLYLDERKIPALAEATRKAGAWVVPTMALWETFNSTESPEAMAQRAELQFVPRQWVEGWVKQKTTLLANLNPEAGRRVIEVRKKVLKALRDAGVRIAFGTDSPQVFSVPGFSTHREIPILREAGLTPYEILVSGTRHVAEYFGTLAETGTVERGKRADLILLEANPLADPANLARRAGVMVAGRWIPETEIQKRLAAMASR